MNICLSLLRHLGGPDFVLSCAPMVVFIILVVVVVVVVVIVVVVVVVVVVIAIVSSEKERTFVETCYGTLVVLTLC